MLHSMHLGAPAHALIHLCMLVISGVSILVKLPSLHKSTCGKKKENGKDRLRKAAKQYLRDVTRVDSTCRLNNACRRPRSAIAISMTITQFLVTCLLIAPDVMLYRILFPISSYLLCAYNYSVVSASCIIVEPSVDIAHE